MIVREARVDDVDGIRQLSAAAGQTGIDSGADPAYVSLLLETARVRVAVDDANGVVGWGAVRAGPLGSMLTDLFVHPRWHGHGAGGAVLRELWPDPGEPRRFTFASQHPSALPLYVRAGLRPRWPLLYLSGPRLRRHATPLRVTPVGPDAAGAAEAALCGVDRTPDYRLWTRTGRAIVVADGARTIAVGALRDGTVVHLACAEPAFAEPALVAALAATGADADQLAVCLPGSHPALAELFRARFRVSAQDTAMSTPDLDLPTCWAYAPGLA